MTFLIRTHKRPLSRILCNTLVVTIIFLNGSAYAQTNLLNKKISIDFIRLTLAESLKKTEKQTGISFAYDNSLVNQKEKVNLQFKNKSISYILQSLLKNRNLKYRILEDGIVIYPTRNKTGKITFTGYVYDAETGESLIGCSIYEKNSMAGTTSNNFGFFSLQLPSGEQTINVSYIGYKKQEFTINSDKEIKIKLIPVENPMEEVVVSAIEKDRELMSSAMGKIELSSTQINQIPSIAGETDVLKAITLLPGIKQGVDGSSGFYVRGGGPDQNLILLDGVPMYNPYHLWGFLSTFNADAINHIEITKGAFPARYGGRLSSVLDITMNEGNNQKWKKDFTVGLLSAKFTVSGPIRKDKSSIMISARRTYADLIIVPIRKAINSSQYYKNKQGYNFTDINLKFNYTLSEKDRIYVSGFYSRDKNYFDQISNEKINEINYTERSEMNQGWGNMIGSVRWNHILGKKLFSNTTAYYSAYKYYTENQYNLNSNDPEMIQNKENSSNYFSNIDDLALKLDFQYFPSNNHNIRFGAEGIYHIFTPGVNSYYSKTGEETIHNSIENNTIPASELSVYAEDDMEIGSIIKMNAGIRMSGFSVQNSFYHSIEPRLSYRFLVNKKLSFKIGYAHMTQYLHLITSSGIVQSSDLWVPATDTIKPEKSDQLSIGTVALLGNSYQLEVEVYTKKMHDIIDYKDGASFLSSETGWEDKVATGNGESFGLEVFFQKRTGKLTGWIGYTLSWTNRQFEEINFGRKYPYRYDRRHDISIVGNYRFSERWSLNGSWVFYTGNAVTVPTTAYNDPYYTGKLQYWHSFPDPNTITGSPIGTSGKIDNATKRNNYRLPAYHRMDVTATYTKLKDWGLWKLSFGFTNLYNRFNPSYYRVSHEQDLHTGKSKVVYYQVTLFPLMPTVNFSISF